MEEIAPILIAGAGPVGLSLALGLAHHGVRSVIFEQKPKLSEHSKALLITTRTLEIFRAWGVLDRFVQESPLVTEFAPHVVGRARPPVKLNLDRLKEFSAIGGVVILPQNRTEALLFQQAQETDLIDVRFNHSINSFTQDEKGVTVQVQVEGSATQEFRGPYLIGCDGAHSAVRGKLGWHLEGKTYPSRIMLADVHVQEADRERLLLAPLARGAMAGIRFAPGQWRIIATLKPEESDETAISPAAIQNKVEQLFGTVNYECVWSSVFRIHCRNSPHFHKGRVILAGDAAHLNSPAGGQGMNSGIQDTQNLAWKLARALGGGDAESLLHSYEQERREAMTKGVERFTDMLTRLMLMKWPLVRAVILRIIQLALKQPSVQKTVMQRMAMLNIGYSRSALLSGEGQWLGKRAPDGDLLNHKQQRVRLFDIANSQAVLVLFDDGNLPGWNRAEIQKLLESVPELQVIRVLPHTAPSPPEDENTLVDVTGHIWSQWQATGNLAALIRPDGHVGWMAERPTPAALRSGVQKALGFPRK